MELLRLVLRYAHLIGFALLLGAAVVQLVVGPIRINRVMVWGALIQLATGIALAAPLRGDDPEPAPAKLGVKLLIALLIAVMVVMSRKRERVNTGHFAGIIVLTLANAAVATFWTG